MKHSFYNESMETFLFCSRLGLILKLISPPEEYSFLPSNRETNILSPISLHQNYGRRIDYLLPVQRGFVWEH